MFKIESDLFLVDDRTEVADHTGVPDLDGMQQKSSLEAR